MTESDPNSDISRPRQELTGCKIVLTDLRHFDILHSGQGDAPDFVEVGEAGIAVNDAMRRQRRVQQWSVSRWRNATAEQYN
jgi:hypothetical protein